MKKSPTLFNSSRKHSTKSYLKTEHVVPNFQMVREADSNLEGP